MTQEFSYVFLDSPLDALKISASDQGVVALDFIGKKKLQADRIGSRKSGSYAEKAKRQLLEYFTGRRRRFDLTYDLRDFTVFQKECWRVLTEIPFGKVVSYEGQALAMRSKAVRAVGSANGRNPLPIFIPCHRVVRKDGSLGGYSSGLEKKEYLLRLEGIL